MSPSTNFEIDYEEPIRKYLYSDEELEFYHGFEDELEEEFYKAKLSHRDDCCCSMCQESEENEYFLGNLGGDLWDWGTGLFNDSSKKSYGDAIKLFGKHVVNPHKYPKSIEGFQRYLDDTGIIYFSAKEMIKPKSASKAAKFGYKVFLPKQDWWPRGAALASLADICRSAAASPVSMRNWWRPKGYNEAVGGKSKGDHPTAHGIDLDYKTRTARRAAEAKLKFYQSTYPWLQISLGLGYRTTHVGIMSPRGKRSWKYNSYTP